MNISDCFLHPERLICVQRTNHQTLMAVNKVPWETYLKTFLCASCVLMTAEAYGGAGLVSADAPGRASALGEGGEGEGRGQKAQEGGTKVVPG